MTDWSIVEFRKEFDRAGFDCGNAGLNDYLRRYASQDLRRGLSRAYAAVGPDGRIVGYYTVSSAQVACAEVPGTWKGRVGVYPVPCSRIGRLAVDRTAQGRGLGAELLMHAYHTVQKAALHIGIKALIVDAVDEAAERFYLKYGFERLSSSGTKGRTLFLPLD